MSLMPKSKPLLLSLLSLTLLTDALRAQSLDMNPSDSRAIRLEASFEPEADLDGGGNLETWQTRLRVPFFGTRLGTDWFLGLQLNHEMTFLDLNPGLLADEELTRLEVGAILGWRPEGSKWTALLGTWGGVSTDWSEINGEDFVLRVLAAGGYRFSDRFTLLFGAYYSNDFGDATVFPGPGFIWKVTDAWTASLIPPRLRVSYAFNDLWSLSAEAYPDGGTWSAESVDGDQATVERKNFRTGLRLERRLGEKGAIHIGAGWALGRELRAEREDNGSLLFESDVDDGLYISTGFSYSF
jgi:hypothetical protein